MSPKRRAVIDVGTNSVKLLVADVSGRAVAPLLEKSEQTRLGAGFYETHILQPAAISQTAQAIARFVRAAAGLNPERIRVIATSAARAAIKQPDLVRDIDRACGPKGEVSSG